MSAEALGAKERDEVSGIAGDEAGNKENGNSKAESRHLFFKGVAGLLLGFPLSLWISWLVMYSGWGPAFAPARDQVSMWLVVPLWCTVLSVSFLAESRVRCLAWLLAANILAAGLWWGLQ